jgi:hypothetical protein
VLVSISFAALGVSCVTSRQGPSGENVFFSGRLMPFASTWFESDCLATEDVLVLFGSLVFFESIFGFVRAWTR